MKANESANARKITPTTVKLDRRYEDLTDRHDLLLGGGYRARAYIEDVAETLAQSICFDLAPFSELRFE